MASVDELLSQLERALARATLLDHERRFAQAIETYNHVHTTINSINSRAVELSARQRALMRCITQFSPGRQQYLIQNQNVLKNIVALPSSYSMTKTVWDSNALSWQQTLDGSEIPSVALNIDFTQNCGPLTPVSVLAAASHPAQRVDYTMSFDRDVLSQTEWIDYFWIRERESNQAMWVLEFPRHVDRIISESVLHRVSEMMASECAVQTYIAKSRGRFKLRMKSDVTGWVLEQSDRGRDLSHWTPRRFRYGRRQFVWKTSDDFSWEYLVETSSVQEQQQQQNGEKNSKGWFKSKSTSKNGGGGGQLMNDEVIGTALCWGRDGCHKHPESGKLVLTADISFKAGLDQGFVEHCLASTLSRWLRQKFPDTDDSPKLKAKQIGMTVFGVLAGAV